MPEALIVGGGKGAIHHHFSSKTLLFGAALERLEEAEVLRMRATYDAAPGSLVGLLVVIMRCICARTATAAMQNRE